MPEAQPGMEVSRALCSSSTGGFWPSCVYKTHRATCLFPACQPPQLFTGSLLACISVQCNCPLRFKIAHICYAQVV